MSYRKKIRMEYFEVICKKKEDSLGTPDRFFDLTLIIDIIDRLSLADRSHKYHQEKARIETIRYDNTEDLWFLGFVRLRDTDIPSIAAENKESKPLTLENDQYLGEHACAIYDENLHVLMLQRNIHSIGPSGIEYYFNKVWGSEDEEIYLKPICPIEVQNKILNAYEYRKIDIRLAGFNDPSSMPMDAQKPFGQIINSINRYEATNAVFSISMGYTKTSALNKEVVKDTVNEILENKHIVSGTKVSFRKTPESEIDVLDLFEAKLHDMVQLKLEKRETVASEYIQRVMTEKYVESRGKIIAALNS